MSQTITLKTIRCEVMKAVELNPGLSCLELKNIIPNKRIAHPLFILTRQKKLIRKRVKRLPNPYSGIWIYFVPQKQQNAA